MTTLTTVLFEAKLAESVDTVQYTSADVRTSIDKLTAHNTSGSNATLTINLLAPASAVGTANRVVSKVIPGGTTYTFPEVVGHVLDVGGAISTDASTAGVLSIRASGRQFS